MKTAHSKADREVNHHSIVNHEKKSFFLGQTHSAESFFSPVIMQPKLKMGAPDDQYERQADRVAEAVVSSPAPKIQQESMEEEEETLQRKCSDCEKEEEIQMKSDAGQSAGTAPSAISQKIQNAGGGSHLPESVNNEMSQKIGANFSNVNIHTGPEASRLNQSLGARAFTHGNNVFFNSGEYNPGSREGKRLLAHELTHVVQQGNNRFIQRDDNVITLPDVYIWEPDEVRYNTDYRQAWRVASTYIDSAQTTVSAMLIDYLEAQRQVEQIMALEDPQSIWETVTLMALSTIISAIPGAGPVARRLTAIENSRGGFYAKGLEEGLKQIASHLSVYSVQVNDSSPQLSPTPGPLGQIRRANNIVQIEIDRREEIFTNWEEAWQNAKTDTFLPPWEYDLHSRSVAMFQPRTNLPSGTFQLEFEKMLAEQAIRRSVQARSGILLFGGQTVYSFYRPSLSRESLRELVNRYGWSISQIVTWARRWPGGAMPWNHYQIEEGEEI